MALSMSARMATGVSCGGSSVLGASIRALGVASRRSFQGGVKIQPVFHDSCFFPRVDGNLGGKHRQAVRREGSSVAMNATADSRLQEVRMLPEFPVFLFYNCTRIAI